MLALLALAAAIPFKETATYNVLLNGAPAGTARITKLFHSDGSMRESLSVTAHARGQTQTLTFDKVLNARGIVTEKTLNGRTANVGLTVVARFGTRTVTVTAKGQGKTITKAVAIPAGPIAQTSAFWFSSTKPQRGATSDFNDFDLESGKWRRSHDVYAGDSTYRYHGRIVRAHQIRHVDGYELDDDHGMSYEIVLNAQGGKSVFVRQ